MMGKKNEKLISNFDRTFKEITKFYTSYIEIFSITEERYVPIKLDLCPLYSITKENYFLFLSEALFWKEGKITERVDLNAIHPSPNVEKVKINFETDTLILLMNSCKLAFYKNRRFIKQIDLNSKESLHETKHKFLFINDINQFKSIHLAKEESDKSLFLFDFINFLLIEVKIENISKLDNINMKRAHLIDTSKLNQNDRVFKSDQIVIVHRELEYVLFIDKCVKKFSFVSYKKQIPANLIESNSITYLNYNDEKEVDRFFKLFSNYTKYKFKVWKIKNLEIFFSISILKRENDIENKVHSSLVVNARIIRSTSKNNRSVEIEIVKVYAFCKRFHFFEEDNSKNMILSFYYTNPEIRKLESEDGHLILINASESKVLLRLDLNKFSKPKIKNLCVDSKVEYLAFNDRNKFLWLFRINDAKKLACLPLYGFVNQIKFNEDSSYVCLNMYDRRIFNLLIVDPDRDEHKNRIKSLNSRREMNFLNKEQQVESPKIDFIEDHNFENLFLLDSLPITENSNQNEKSKYLKFDHVYHVNKICPP